jgi:hypothetical protein
MLIVLILLVIAGLGWILIGSLAGISRSTKRAAANKDVLLDRLFDGRDQVLFEGKLVGLQPDLVMEGAGPRGYRLVQASEGAYGTKTLLFEKAS